MAGGAGAGGGGLKSRPHPENETQAMGALTKYAEIITNLFNRARPYKMLQKIS